VWLVKYNSLYILFFFNGSIYYFVLFFSPEQSKAYMEQKLRNKESFVKTRAFNKSLDCLTMNGVLVIIGNAGDGKTTLAVNILDSLKQQGYIELVFSDPKQLEESIDPDR
jgi:polynucleotide 5'-kinase involved in rRNA processing